jgi:hypothetical protein
MFFLGLIWLAVVVIEIMAGWKIFEKAGQPGWASIIPIYSTYVMLKIVGKPTWWLVMICLVPIANIVYAIWLINMLSKSFGKEEGFTVGMILLGIIFWPILGFGDAKYIGPYGNPEAFKAAQTPAFDFDKPAIA